MSYAKTKLAIFAEFLPILELVEASDCCETDSCLILVSAWSSADVCDEA